jgi:hypothetical protein
MCVNRLDYVTWAINSGQGPNDGETAPEPGALSLLVLGVFIWALRRRFR